MEKSKWIEMGLKCGLEIHQQLDTKKLFCDCDSKMIDKEPDFTVTRKQKAVTGESGEKDIAAEAEEIRDRTFVYEGYDKETCLVELDEEPPHGMNTEALKTALQVAKSLDMTPFDEVEVMRKTVVNGSNTSGFQRTALVAENGHVDMPFGKVEVDMLSLEEDAAREMFKDDKKVNYRLDRLGIPLIELGTGPDMHSPEEVREVAERLGMLMRMTGRVKRGLGTIRQDVNVSITGGKRVEVKGFQELGDIPKVVELEAERQKNLIHIADELKKRGAEPILLLKDVTEILKSAKDSKLVLGALERGEKFYGTIFKGYNGILKKPIQGERTYAKELVDYLKHYTSFKGFIHTDELPKYGIDEKQIFQLRKLFDAEDQDLIMFISGTDSALCERGLGLVKQRAEQLLQGVPGEVRFVNEDMTTHFLRPMPGASRMYPETDVLPIQTKEMWKLTTKPLLPEERIKIYQKMGLSPEMAKQVLHSTEMIIFEETHEMFPKISTSWLASMVLGMKDEIRKRYETNVGNLTREHFEESLALLSKDKIAKEAVIEILAYLAGHPDDKAEEVMIKLKLNKINVKELEEITEQVMKENAELVEKRQFGVVMGFLMRKVRGRIDGELVSEVLKKKMKV